MVLYNVTVRVEQAVEAEWLAYMKEQHIPDVLKTGFFEGYYMAKILAETDPGAVAYAIQYRCKSQTELARYEKECAPALREDFIGRFGEKALSFRTLLEVIHER